MLIGWKAAYPPLIHPISIHKFHQYDRYSTTKSTHQTAFQPTIRQAPSYGDLRTVGIRILPQRTPHQRNYRIIASSGENRQQKVRFMITFATFFERRLSLYQGYSKGIRSRSTIEAHRTRLASWKRPMSPLSPLAHNAPQKAFAFSGTPQKFVGTPLGEGWSDQKSRETLIFRDFFCVIHKFVPSKFCQL